jgi:hypothetical protein
MLKIIMGRVRKNFAPGLKSLGFVALGVGFGVFENHSPAPGKSWMSVAVRALFFNYLKSKGGNAMERN